MAKQYRKPTNELTSIYGGGGPERRKLNIKEELAGGITPKQHCERKIATRKSGRFVRVSEHEDACMLYGCNFYGDCHEATEYSYYYAQCTEIEFTITVNGKAVKSNTILHLTGGERVVIKANQEVTWSTMGARNLEKISKDMNSYTFTARRMTTHPDGAAAILAISKCDPNHRKGVLVRIKEEISDSKQFSKELFITELYAAMDKFGIKEKNDRAAFLANVEHETKGFKSLTESEGLKYRFKIWKAINNNTKNWVTQHGKNAEADFAKLSERDKINIMYEGMNGNYLPDDGWTYRGRGALQVTGRNNYQAFADYIKRPEIVSNPDLIAHDMKLAAQASAWYWKVGNKVVSQLALKGDFRTSRVRVNNGTHGLEEVLKFIKGYLNNKGTIPLHK